MRSFSGTSLLPVAVAALATAITLTAVGCGQVQGLKGRKAYKDANAAYQTQDYKKAADLYKTTIEADPDAKETLPAYFFLANSLDNLYKPSKKGDPANDQLMEEAVKNYQMAADKLSASDNPDYKKLGKLSLQYLVAAYGTDKLNDPGKAEPVLQNMIRQEPSDVSNYFVLARLYEDAGVYDESERMFLAARDAKPNDASVYTNLAAFYNRQGKFPKTIEALEQRAQKEQNNPEAWQTIAVYYQDEARKDARLKENEKRDYIGKGLVAVDKALSIKPDYADAMTYKGLLLRLQANLEKDPTKQQDLLKKAKELQDQSEETRKKKAAGA
ncbi:MAG TPA: tetratricopeptide repeat protein [Vicinamibacterales bacterium]|nr:tetratricopeptide repeat protein [Vicinamibacterales bacterium]